MVGERDMKPLRGDDAFADHILTSWHLMKLGSKCMQLTSRMDSTTLVMVNTLMGGR
jgi:hypothetical protein